MSREFIRFMFFGAQESIARSADTLWAAFFIQSPKYCPRGNSGLASVSMVSYKQPNNDSWEPTELMGKLV